MPAKLRSVLSESSLKLRSPSICSRCLVRIHSQRSISTTSPKKQEARPRWSYTPERVRAPVSTNFANKSEVWPVNENPEQLDAFYVKLLGDGGDTLLSDEVKWLAVTHKTFEQGQRGYNDRLAFLGMQIRHSAGHSLQV